MKKIITILTILISQVGFSQDLKPTETEALLKVYVHNNDKTPRVNEVIFLKGLKGKTLYKGTSGKDGKFSILIKKGDTYKIDYKFFGDSIEYSTFEIPGGDNTLFTQTFELIITPPKTYTLENVFFDTGKATLRPESFKSLNDIVEVLKMKPTMIIEIAGHTDDVGEDEANMTLSQNRAESVRKYIVSKGIVANRITAKGYGETQPIADNNTSQGKQKNRRTEVRIIKE